MLRYQTNILLRGLKICTHTKGTKLRLVEFFQNKESNGWESNDVLNNINLQETEAKYKSNVSNIKQKQLSRLRNDEAIVIKTVKKRSCSNSLNRKETTRDMMQHLSDKNKYRYRHLHRQ